MSQQDTTSNNQVCMYSQILPTHAHHTIMFSSIHRKYYTLEPSPPKLDSVVLSRPIHHTACAPCSACLHTFHVFLTLPLCFLGIPCLTRSPYPIRRAACVPCSAYLHTFHVFLTLPLCFLGIPCLAHSPVSRRVSIWAQGSDMAQIALK
jgi:hypothetical protein